MAEVCADTRPGWDGDPVSAAGEAIALFASPMGIVLVISTLAALRFRSQWGALVVVVLWTGLVTMVTMLDPTGVRDLAQAEGCIGSPTLFIALVAAICVGTILYTMPRETRL